MGIFILARIMRHVAPLVFLLCLFTTAFGYGILRAEEIWSNEDTSELHIEEIIIKESDIFVDFIEDVSLNGVTVEGSIFSDGSVTVPGNLTTTAGIKFFSALFANGNIIADNGTDSGEVSFTVEADTGNTFILGEVRAQGGINLEDGLFTMEETTGDTTIAQALLRPNGGINVRNQLFTVNTGGDIYTKGQLHVNDNIYFGTNAESDRVIQRIPASGPFGGATYLQGQNAPFRGGDLFLEPGDSIVDPGNILIGDTQNRDLFFGRAALTNGLSGGEFTFGGQNSLDGDGGKLYISAGDSSSNVAFGGDIIIAPGLSDGSGVVGEVIIGSTRANSSGYDLIIGRPDLDGGDGGHTVIAGQNSEFGAGGELYFRAGSVRTGYGAPGNLVLSPGDSRNNPEGTIYLGRPLAVSLTIRREVVAPSAGVTVITGQTGLLGKGGDLYFVGGSAGQPTVDFDDGGDLYLTPGATLSGEGGKIFVGRSTDPLILGRPTNAGNGRHTIYRGQDGLTGAGGDFYLAAGPGHTSGGDFFLASGTAGFGDSGDITLAAGSSPNSFGGDVYFRAGHGEREIGGDIYINAGDSVTAVGGRVIFSAGSGGFGDHGDFIVGPAVRQFYVEQVPVFVEQNLLRITGGQDTLEVQADPDGWLIFNGNVILRSTVPVSFTNPDALNINVATTTALNRLVANYQNLLQALNTGCDGHGLIILENEVGTIIDPCPF